jgi:hypothetical protein
MKKAFYCLPAVLLGTLLVGACLLPGTQSVAQAPKGQGASVRTSPKAAFDVSHFESKVRPLLVAQCLPCHSEKSANGGVRLDQALTPEMAQKMLVAVRHTGKIKMPASGKMPAGDIATLETWVAQGTQWPVVIATGNKNNRKNHWSFFPPRRATIPVVKNKNWGKNPVDAFLLAEMERSGSGGR